MTLMTVGQFEQHCHKLFSERLLTIRNAEDSESSKLMRDMFNELEAVAIGSGLEICPRGAYLLSLAVYDLHLGANADALGVSEDYFTSEDRAPEVDALEYLHLRRCGMPAGQFITAH
jgi:hypothetical protein